MSQDNVRAFFEEVETDGDLSERYKSLLKGMAEANVDEGAAIAQVVQFASERGYEFASEDLRSVAGEMKGEALSDEELDAVAGGVRWVIIGVTDMGDSGSACLIVGF